MNFEVRGDDDAAEKRDRPVVAAVDARRRQNQPVFVGQFGDASANKALAKAFEDDFKKAETLSLPITLIILVLAFGALVAAGIPLLLALSAVLATLGLVALPSHIVPHGRHDQLDRPAGRHGGGRRLHALLPAPRARGARARALAIARRSTSAAATSGRAVLISGFTVMIAMAGMFFAGDRTFTRWASARSWSSRSR